MHDAGNILMCIFYSICCIWIGRETGYTLDKQNRKPEGKPKFVLIPNKWLWLFRYQKNEYAAKYNILRTSIYCHLLGYAFSVFEVLVLLYVVISKNKTALSEKIFFAYILLMSAICIPESYRYERNLQRAYDYDWITYLQEAFRGVSRRKCTVVEQKGDGIYEIVFGKWNKRRYVAKATKTLNIGDVKYARHIYGEKGPYWLINR